MTSKDKAFPYSKPTNFIKKKYSYMFIDNFYIKEHVTKILFDKVVSFLLLIFCLPLIICLKILYIIEGLFIKENKGPLFFYYYAISKGKSFKKYKLRVIKTKFINLKLAEKGDWRAYKAEWNKSSKTYIGSLVKKFYLDEIPQLWSVFVGDMSIVGPRPLSKIHYDKDLKQGNITRKLIKGGLLGLGHIHKGKKEFGDPIFEYQYIDIHVKKNGLQVLFFDLKIIFLGIILMIKGGGH